MSVAPTPTPSAMLLLVPLCLQQILKSERSSIASFGMLCQDALSRVFEYEIRMCLCAFAVDARQVGDQKGLTALFRIPGRCRSAGTWWEIGVVEAA